MTRRPKDQEKPGADAPGRQPGGKSHQWQGQAVEDPAPGEEQPERKASRAGGNEPLDVHAAIERDAAPYYPETVGLGGEGDAETEAPEGDDAENNEEKRQAAAEEHAAAPSRRAPHGNL